MEKETKMRAWIYGANMATPPVAHALSLNLLDRFASSANFWGALFYGATDLAGRLSPKIKKSTFVRVAKLVGAAYYAGSVLHDISRIYHGDMAHIYNLAFDGSMASLLVKDVAANYNGQNDLLNDLKGPFNRIKGLASRLQTY